MILIRTDHTILCASCGTNCDLVSCTCRNLDNDKIDKYQVYYCRSCLNEGEENGQFRVIE